MHKGHWEKLEDLLAEMTDEEKRQVIQRVVESLNGGRTAEGEAERSRKQHLAWQQLWKDLESCTVKERKDGLIGSIDVDKIIYGKCDRD